MPPLESALEQRLFQAVKKAGGVTIKLAPTHVGVPDRLVITPSGVFHLVELKKDGGRLSPAQVLWHERTKARTGVSVAVLTGRGELDAWLAQVLLP